MMKKWLKVVLGVGGILLFCFIIDMISIFTRNKPVFAVRGSESNIYEGLFYDTYICSEYSVPQIKMKKEKFSCAEAVQLVEQYTYMIETVETVGCNQDKVLYISRENQNIYTYCLDSIKVREGDCLVDLKDYYQENNSIFEDLVNHLEVVDTYKDGGSKLYRDNDGTGLTNDGLSVIWCNTLEGNQDIYIGPKSMEYENGFCKYDERMREFN